MSGGPPVPPVRVLHGLPPHLLAEAAALYWSAFGAKLGRVMGPQARAVAYLTRIIDPGHALAAVDDAGRLVGILGFKTYRGAFAEGRLRDLAAVYGWPGALWRGALLDMLSREVDNGRFLFDGICVPGPARGQGVGTRLIAEAAQVAAGMGYAEMRLDVIDTNLRARALYERLGFRAVGVHRLGALRHVFGFDAAVTMVRAV